MKNKIRKSFQVVSIAALLSAMGWATYKIIRHLHTSPAFEVKQVLVLGQKRVEETQVLTQADLPAAANIFSADLDGIRSRVEALQWVRHAMVQRVLPDRITIKIIERQPIGLARIRGEIYQFDEDAVVLDSGESFAASFPVLDGLNNDDPEGNLRKVELYRRVVEELQGQTELSEVHINDAGEVSVVSASDPMTVQLGMTEFRPKWIRHLQLRGEIQRKFPDAVQVDYRFGSDVIVRMRPDAPVREMVIWDGEKKSL